MRGSLKSKPPSLDLGAPITLGCVIRYSTFREQV